MNGLLQKVSKVGKEAKSSSDFWHKVLIDTTVVVGVISPIMTLPQIVKIFSTHNASGVSAISWFAFALLDVPFLIYGIVYKQKPITTTYTLHLIANLIVAVGAVMYG